MPQQLRTLIYRLFFLLLLPGCALLPSHAYRQADRLAEAGGFAKSYLAGDRFDLLAYRRISRPGAPLTVYLEGDGAAWLTPNRLSADPTPKHPLVLQLAAMDPAANVVYLARPCQFVMLPDRGRNCQETHWSDQRFSEEMVTAIDQAISELVAETAAPALDLVGYSGGGALAVLVAARRQDVRSLRTVAGNLDHQEFSRYHRVSPLSGSLNPIDVAEKVALIPQLHFVGRQDDTVPERITERFLAALPAPNCAGKVEVAEADHANGWLAQWPGLLQRQLPCAAKPE